MGVNDPNQPELTRTPSGATEQEDARLRPFPRSEWMRQVHQIRKQEFAYLRSLQKREANDGAEPTMAGFQAMTPSIGSVREDTLKKIDEIEARLNLLWVANHSKPGPLSRVPTPTPPSPQAQLPPMGLSTGPVSVLRPITAPGLFTQTMYDVEMPSSVLLVNTVDTHSTRLAPADSRPLFASAVKPALAPAAKVGLRDDRTLATAAALFANGENELAAQHLLRAVRAARAMSAESHNKAQSLQWLLGLLEIYRATGNQAQFDWSVLEYFDYWEGITPQWRNMAKLGNGTTTPNQQTPCQSTTLVSSNVNKARVWRCPSVLDRSAGRQWRAHWLANPHCAIDWTSLSAIDADAAADLVSFLQSTEQGPMQLVFFDTPNLLYVLEQSTPQGQAQVPRSLWGLRFRLLGLMHMRVAFDAAAADYCVTFIEDSPVWHPGQARFDGDAIATPLSSQLPDPEATDTPWRLTGHLLGANAIELPDQSLGQSPKTISISCAMLARMDDDATSQLLQWVQQAKVQQADVHFTNVSLLVGSAWTAIGMDAHARISLRDPG